MKFKKGGLLFAAVVALILLSVLAATLAGVLRSEQIPEKTEEEEIPLTAEAYLQKAMRLSNEHKFEEACGSYNVAIVYAHIDEDWEKALLALKGQANCFLWMGAADTCIYRYQKALALAKELNHTIDEYEIYDHLRQAYTMNVDMQNVMRMEQKIDSIESLSSDKRIAVRKQLRLANEALQQQNMQLGEHFLRKAEHLLKSLSISDRQIEQFQVYGSLTTYYWGRLDFQNAKKYNRLMIDAAQQAFKGQPLACFPTFTTDALLCAQEKDKTGALAALDSMLYCLALANGGSPRDQMVYYRTKGDVHSHLGELGKACDAYRQALSAVENSYVKNGPEYFQIVNMLGGAFFHSQKYDEARPCFEVYSEFCEYQYGAKSLPYADALWALANFEGHCGKIDLGKKYYVKSVDICKQMVTEQLRYLSVQERNTFWMAFAPKMWSMSAYAMKIGEQQSPFTEKCYEALLFSKALLLETDRTMAMAIAKECSLEEQQIYYDMQRLQNQLKALSNNYGENKARIEDLYLKISKQNQQLTPIISKLGYTTFLSQGYSDIRHLLDDDEVLLDFVDIKSDEEVQQYAAFVVDGKQAYPKLVKSFTEEALKMMMAGKKDYSLYLEPYASKAVSMIWMPFINEVKGKKTIYYVPSGMLHRIALESLPLKDGSLLGEHYHFVRLTSAREIERVKYNRGVESHATATLYGALKYDMDTTMMALEASRYHVNPQTVMNRGSVTRGGRRFEELPNTKEELDHIQAILSSKHLSVKERIGTKGTEESFWALSGKAPNILHIATHGFYYNTPEEASDNSYLRGYNDAMQLSGLIMAGGNRAWLGQEVPQGVLGGVLTANSIAGLDLRGLDLVVLSACQTGLGATTPEGIYGLQRAFKKAGAQTIIMTLWSVDDEATKDFMIMFYEELTRNQWNKRDAFEKAKAFVRNKTYIRKGKNYKGQPYFWAGFVMLD